MLHPKLLALINPTRKYTYKADFELGSVTTNDADTQEILIQDDNFIVTDITVSGYYLEGGVAKRILPTASDQDMARVLIKFSGGQTDMMSDAMDMHTFNAAHSGENFAGILLPARTKLSITVSNEIITATNMALPVYYEVAFGGYLALSAGSSDVQQRQVAYVQGKGN